MNDGDRDTVDCGSGSDTAYVSDAMPTVDALEGCENVTPVPPELTDPNETNDSVIIGGPGNDVMNGTPAADLMLGGPGNDQVSGLDGNDHLEGDEGNDTLDGGLGEDRLYGRRGNDHLLGGEGNDHLEGNFGNDVLEGGNGNDYLEDNLGQNQFLGGAGDDYVQAANNGLRDLSTAGPERTAPTWTPSTGRWLRGREALAPTGAEKNSRIRSVTS